MKKRYVIALYVLLFFAVLVIPVLALDIHALLSRDAALLTLSPLIGWGAITQTQQVRKMYLLLLAALGLGLIWILASGSNLQYRSNMQQITPDIQTPCAAGQGQYGTARWMPKRKFPQNFPIVQFTDFDIDELLRAGRQDQEEINEKENGSTGRRSGSWMDRR